MKANLRKQIESVINHPLMSDIEPCKFVCYGDMIFTYDKQSITDAIFQISFIPIDPLVCVLESETIEQILSIPFNFLEVLLIDEVKEETEILIRYAPKNAFDYTLN